mgnify:CR=1 FL=1
MLFMALLLRPWHMQQAKEGKIAFSLADDILVVVLGQDMCDRFAAALRATHQYLVDIGAKVSPTNNFNFASTSEIRQWLRDTMWETIGSAIEVVDHFRYLGAHMSISGRYRVNTLMERFGTATALLARVAKLPVTRWHKAKIIRAKVFPAALYGSEVAQPTEKEIATLATAVV